jgi:hypothetical protein
MADGMRGFFLGLSRKARQLGPVGAAVALGGNLAEEAVMNKLVSLISDNFRRLIPGYQVDKDATTIIKISRNNAAQTEYTEILSLMEKGAQGVTTVPAEKLVEYRRWQLRVTARSKYQRNDLEISIYETIVAARKEVIENLKIAKENGLDVKDETKSMKEAMTAARNGAANLLAQIALAGDDAERDEIAYTHELFREDIEYGIAPFRRKVVSILNGILRPITTALGRRDVSNPSILNGLRLRLSAVRGFGWLTPTPPPPPAPFPAPIPNDPEEELQQLVRYIYDEAVRRTRVFIRPFRLTIWVLLLTPLVLFLILWSRPDATVVSQYRVVLVSMFLTTLLTIHLVGARTLGLWIVGLLITDPIQRDPITGVANRDANGNVIRGDDIVEILAEIVVRSWAFAMMMQPLVAIYMIHLPAIYYQVPILVLIAGLLLNKLGPKSTTISGILYWLIVVFTVLSLWKVITHPDRREEAAKARSGLISDINRLDTLAHVALNLNMDSTARKRAVRDSVRAARRAASPAVAPAVVPPAVIITTPAPYDSAYRHFAVGMDMDEERYDTGLDVYPGQCVKVTSTGSYTFRRGWSKVTYRGDERFVVSEMVNADKFPIGSAHPGALVGYIGNDPMAAFYQHECFPIPHQGRLYLGSNDNREELNDNNGILDVEIVVLRRP